MSKVLQLTLLHILNCDNLFVKHYVVLVIYIFFNKDVILQMPLNILCASHKGNNSVLFSDYWINQIVFCSNLLRNRLLFRYLYYCIQ